MHKWILIQNKNIKIYFFSVLLKSLVKFNFGLVCFSTALPDNLTFPLKVHSLDAQGPEIEIFLIKICYEI